MQRSVPKGGQQSLRAQRLYDINPRGVDARTLPPDVQAEARRKRLIPDLDPD